MSETYFPDLKDIMTAAHTLNEILVPTPLMKNRNLSERYGANVLLKREDLQMVRSYKIRGAEAMLTTSRSNSGLICSNGIRFFCA